MEWVSWHVHGAGEVAGSTTGFIVLSSEGSVTLFRGSCTECMDISSEMRL